MRKVILQLELTPQEAASLANVQRKLGLKASQIDAEFGIATVRPEQGQYAVKVDASVAQSVRRERHPERGTRTGADSDVRVALVH